MVTLLNWEKKKTKVYAKFKIQNARSLDIDSNCIGSGLPPRPAYILTTKERERRAKNEEINKAANLE